MILVAEMRERTKGWLPLAEWGPVCAGCGGDEFRIDGYCSIECRDYHCDDAELFGAVLNLIEAAQHWKEINDKAEERGVSQDTGAFIAWQDFCEAVAVFVSGQEEL